MKYLMLLLAASLAFSACSTMPGSETNDGSSSGVRANGRINHNPPVDADFGDVNSGSGIMPVDH